MVKKGRITKHYQNWKKNKNKKYNNKKKRNITGRRKGFKKYVKNVATEVMKKNLETKYINTDLNNYTTIDGTTSGVDNVNNRCLVDLSQYIDKGDYYYNRIGQFIDRMYIQLRMRIRPVPNSTLISFSTTTFPSTNPYNQIKFLNAYILDVDTTSAITAGDIDHIITRPMENWMDNKQSTEREHKKEFRILCKFKIPIKYTVLTNLDSSTIPSEFNIMNLPKLSYVNLVKKIDKKTLYSDSDNKPVKSRLKLYITWGNYFRNSYEDLDFPQIDYWFSVAYKDP